MAAAKSVKRERQINVQQPMSQDLSGGGRRAQRDKEFFPEAGDLMRFRRGRSFAVNGVLRAK